ncbi:E3 ubiquitin-protein ligase Mdm2-like isoform X5 [Amphibalanus amphitrite]|uniref:E3 ubiquitin-protein ligase Mdm2-like isoform X5 n=1 Tax=Amphibalanus amphitrite TaxID=1232801 RepID=UPI001C90C635|nr:E3 ubiquitin-protein ligase Mdm2-like isoform X5 [Amphibalanus amphitrite]XP_043224672.1 E3 ubiquitin-protein ligase Mdm2-like isoform X5 [Amphibalanus amphitrite]
MEAAPSCQRRYTLNFSFFEVLQSVGAKKDESYEWKDVIMLFLRYLARRKPSLFDPMNKSRVVCQDDPLGRVFGVASFTKDETRLLVRQQLCLVEDEALMASLPPLPPPGLEPGEQVKRGPTDPDADDPDSKRSRSEAGAAASAPAPAPAAGAGPSSGPGPSVTADLQRMDTLEATDGAMEETRETETDYDEAGDHRRTYAQELEPVDCTDYDSDGFSSSGEESDVESPLHLTVMAVWMDDVGMMADMETSESDAENADTWVCAAPKCRTTNKARKSRCDHCWKMRPDWVVGPRRKRQRRRQRAGLSEKMRRTTSTVAASSATASASPQDSVDTGFGGSQDGASTTADQTCIICCEKSRDAAIIHGLTGCQVTCYTCARKLWKKKDLCPSCRRSIEKIVYLRFG